MHKLVVVEWEDSAQPVSGWHYLDEAPELEVVCCKSVGWIIADNSKVMMIAPNLGDYKSGDGAQGSGFIRIPKNSVTRVIELQESTSCDVL